jgi:enamine deaminase RidA (YjgF/YER057c/UK114 family)
MTIHSITAEDRLAMLGIKLPAPPEPFGIYVKAVQTGNLLFLTGMLPTEGRGAKFIGRVGAELDVEAGRKADKVTRIVRLGVAVATSGDVRDQPKVADAASELLQDVFGKEKNPCRLVWRRKSPARHPGRAGSHLGGAALIQPATRKESGYESRRQNADENRKGDV